jgi:FixJ family two-component response regulator
MNEKQQKVEPIVYVIDDDASLREGLTNLFRSVGIKVTVFGSTEDYIKSPKQDAASCLILDVRLPGMSGLEFQTELNKQGVHTPIVFLTGYADVPMGVQAVKAGAVEFLCKPFRDQDLLDAVRSALERDNESRKADASLVKLRSLFEKLTPREREVMAHVVSGLLNKQIAPRLGVSEITVKVHRASVMRKMEARSLAELVRMADALGMKNVN